MVKKSYTHIFTGLKITLLKKFKKNIPNKFEFTNRLYLLAINKIYLAD